MDRRNFSNIGDEIKDIVQNAVNTRDFHQLNKDIGYTIDGALDEVRRAVGLSSGNRRNWNNPDSGNWQRDGHKENNEAGYNDNEHREQDNNRYGNKGYYYNRRWNRQPISYFTNNNLKEMMPPVKKQNDLIPNIPVGKISGNLLLIFGSIGIGLTGIAVFVLLLIGQLIGKLGFFGTIALGVLPLLCGSVYMSAKGSQIRNRIKRFYRYLRVFQGRSYYAIKELSANTGLSTKYVLKDLRKMIIIGMFPEGHIDEQETCFILNRESYNQYLELQKNMRKQNFEERINSQSEDSQKSMMDSSQTPSADSAMGAELRNAIEGGRECIRQIKEANASIPGEEISGKLYRLEEIISKIFNYVELHPAQLPEIQKFMDYYLPTTLKLVNAYREFDKQSVQGENITAAKNEIENTLDTINIAFEKLFDSLFIDTAMDVSTDISVLKTLLAQEGLTQKDFKSN